jgi:hypothetical protein
LYISEPVVKHSSGNTDIEFENMDFLELTSSEELLLFEAVSKMYSGNLKKPNLFMYIFLYVPYTSICL